MPIQRLLEESKLSPEEQEALKLTFVPALRCPIAATTPSFTAA
jgi:hypothetical protein